MPSLLHCAFAIVTMRMVRLARGGAALSVGLSSLAFCLWSGTTRPLRSRKTFGTPVCLGQRATVKIGWSWRTLRLGATKSPSAPLGASRIKGAVSLLTVASELRTQFLDFFSQFDQFLLGIEPNVGFPDPGSFVFSRFGESLLFTFDLFMLWRRLVGPLFFALVGDRSFRRSRFGFRFRLLPVFFRGGRRQFFHRLVGRAY